MKVLVFSDTHLTTTFDAPEFKLLSSLIQNADKVIINGDFWEGWLISFDDFLNSEWRRLFPLLRAKSAVYIYGNHDKKELSDKRVALFSVEQGHEYRFKQDSKVFVVRHGDDFKMSYKKFAYTKLGRKISRSPFTIRAIATMERLVIKLGIWKRFYAKAGFNDEAKIELSEQNTPDTITICGHTHQAEMDLKNNYVNSGFIRFGLAQYVVVNNGEIELREERF